MENDGWMSTQHNKVSPPLLSRSFHLNTTEREMESEGGVNVSAYVGGSGGRMVHVPEMVCMPSLVK